MKMSKITELTEKEPTLEELQEIVTNKMETSL